MPEHPPRRSGAIVPAAGRDAVGAERRRPRSCEEMEADPDDRERGERDQRRSELAHEPEISCEPCGQRDGAEQHGHEHHPLQASRDREQDRRSHEHLAGGRRLGEGTCHRPERERRSRQERRLGHQQAAVDERRHHCGHHGSRQRPAQPRLRTRPRISDRRRCRRQESLNGLQHGDSGGCTEQCLREPGEHRIETIEGGIAAEQCKPTRLPE